jgi:hypothetical protein
MGVLVLYIHWLIDPDESSQSLHQFFYIEATETGIESYKSIYGNNQKAIIEAEQAMIGGLGGEKVNLMEKESLILLQAYGKINEKFGLPLPDEINEYLFMLDIDVDYTSSEEDEVFGKTCVNITEREQLINYFIMRYVAKDFTAANYLSYKPFPHDLIDNAKSTILCTNRIEEIRNDDNHPSYMCESLIEDDDQYRIVTTEIKIANKSIVSFEKKSDFLISTAEAAMKLARPEFITVFEIMGDIEKVIRSLDLMYPSALQNENDGGKVYIIFKNNNDHVKEKYYRLNDDINGIIYITNEGQLVLTSYTLHQIHKLENEMRHSSFADLIIALAKYEFKESIFYDFMQSDTGDFLHYIEYVSDYDPEND